MSLGTIPSSFSSAARRSVPVLAHSASWGYFPSGALGTILIVVLILVLMAEYSRAAQPGARTSRDESSRL